MKHKHPWWGIIWRTLAWDAGGGAGLGAIYGALSLLISSIVFGHGRGTDLSGIALLSGTGCLSGSLLGALGGLFVGLISAFLLAISTALMRMQPGRPGRLRAARAVRTLSSSGPAGLVVVLWSGLILTNVSGPINVLFVGTVLWLLLPGLIAAGWLIRRRDRVARWVDETLLPT